MTPSPLAAGAALIILAAIVVPLILDAINYHRNRRNNRK